MRELERNQAPGEIVGLPAGLLKVAPHFRLMRNGEPSFLGRFLRKIGGSIAYRFYW